MATGPGPSGANAVERFVVAPAATAGDRILYVDAPTGAASTRADVADGVARAAAALAARGVQPEQRVLLVLADSPAFLFFFWGAMRLGAVPVPVSTMLTEDDYRFLLDDSRAVGLVVSAPFLPTAGAAAGGRPHLRFVLVDGDPGETSFEAAGDALGAASAADAPPVFPASDDDIAFWLYTSGTTGFPKGARHRHADLACCTDVYARGVLHMGPDDRVYSVAKLFFAYGLGNAGYFPPDTGASAILNPLRPDPLQVAEHVRTHRPTLFFGVPTFYAALLGADLPPDTFASVRLGVSAGEPLPPDIYRRFRERFGVEILDGIGTTEILHIFVSNRPGRSVAGTSGLPVAGYEVELRDAEGAPVADGESGNLWVAGDSVTVGYWNRTAQNRACCTDGSSRPATSTRATSRATTSTSGEPTTCSRSAGSGCHRPRSRRASSRCPRSRRPRSSAPTPATGSSSRARSSSRPRTPTTTRCRRRCRRTCASTSRDYKYPRWVEVVDELPTTATGKVKRYLLRHRPLP